ncbi:TerB family tellurite resistance protein [Hellea balneolensis]|uniref:TerB family tellurite resistance protein n=1 Tax=Hellea balneolensis TaxID=287478 RepID=UPI00047E352D|nr:TerB family tellurite resistance protein [Hellea balneolensis]
MKTHTVSENRVYDSSPCEWRLVMKLVGLMAVANERFTPDDMKAYQDQMMELRAVIDPSLVMTRQMIKDWLINNKIRLKAIINGLEIDSELLAIFQQFRGYSHKFDVLSAMVQVGIADGDYGRTEKMLIKKTILYWNVRGGEEVDALTSIKRSKVFNEA